MIGDAARSSADRSVWQSESLPIGRRRRPSRPAGIMAPPSSFGPVMQRTGGGQEVVWVAAEHGQVHSQQVDQLGRHHSQQVRPCGVVGGGWHWRGLIAGRPRASDPVMRSVSCPLHAWSPNRLFCWLDRRLAGWLACGLAELWRFCKGILRLAGAAHLVLGLEHIHLVVDGHVGVYVCVCGKGGRISWRCWGRRGGDWIGFV